MLAPVAKPPAKRRRSTITLEKRAGHCRGCGIVLAETEHVPGSDRCADCASGAPYCQAATLLGEERFWQVNPPRVNLYAEPGPNRGVRIDNYCIDCGKKVSYHALRCGSCARARRWAQERTGQAANL